MFCGVYLGVEPKMMMDALWEKIRRFPLDDAAADYPFSTRLAQENGWDMAYAQRAMMAYKRFMYLICHTGQMGCPSEEVDQVWHLHLLYTRSYWIDFCKNVLGREIHHGPTRGGNGERVKHEVMYLNTLKLYKEVFGKEAPGDIWPPVEKRFEPVQYIRIPKEKYFIIKKPF